MMGSRATVEHLSSPGLVEDIKLGAAIVALGTLPQEGSALAPHSPADKHISRPWHHGSLKDKVHT
jgi:hypothetical protein